MIDAPLQRTGKDAHRFGHQRSQVVRSVACRQHDDDGNRQVVQILLMRESAVYGEERIEPAVRSEAEQGSVSGACPSHLGDGSNPVGGRKGRP